MCAVRTRRSVRSRCSTSSSGSTPTLPLGETARVERLRALADLGATGRLAREAEGYLARYPDGFARREARQLLAKAKGKH
ncbi:MAG TPA: hypothetical protein VEK07_05335 [Polyangiaceae bacterium]|nr:hypothetical protein [Polyangiaceae bacterium]